MQFQLARFSSVPRSADLHLSVAVQVVQALLAAGAAVNAAESSGATPLHDAARMGHLEVNLRS